MTHNQYITNIQYKIDMLFYEYDTIEMSKYQNCGYYNEYTDTNHYDRLIMEAEEKKGIIRRIIDGIMKIISTAINKVKSFFSKNKNIDKTAEVKVNANLVTRADNFKKKSSKLKSGFTILLRSSLGGAAIYGIIKASNYLDKRATNDGTDTKTMHVGEILNIMENTNKALEEVNNSLKELVSKNPEELGKSEKEYIQEINKLTNEGNKIIDDCTKSLKKYDQDEFADMVRDKKYRDDFDRHSDVQSNFNTLQNRIANKFDIQAESEISSIDNTKELATKMITSAAQIQDIITKHLKPATSRCNDEELNNSAKRYIYKSKKIVEWCIQHTWRSTDYTEDGYNKIYLICKDDYDSIMSKQVSSDGSHVVKLVKKATKYMNDAHNIAKKLHKLLKKHNK